MYDPILCMNVPYSVKTKDAMFNVVYKTDSGTMQALLKAENEKEAENKVRVREGNKFKSLIGVKKMGDSAIDKAIRNCIVDKDIEFPSEKEAIEYCKENGLDPHKIILMGDKYIVRE